MIVRTLESLRGTDREVKSDNWTSTRLLLENDNMGFSFHETTVHANTETKIWYKNHLEAVYCIGGKGEIEEENKTKHPIVSGTLYALDRNDKHTLRAFSEMRMICIFNPPLVGPETHDENGVYPLIKTPEVKH